MSPEQHKQVQKDKIESLKQASIQDLQSALWYVENLATGARNLSSKVNQFCQATNTPVEDYEKQLKLLFEIFTEHDDMSFQIEEAMDERFRVILHNKYTTKKLADVGREIDRKVSAHQMAYEDKMKKRQKLEKQLKMAEGKKGGDQNGEDKPPMQLS